MAAPDDPRAAAFTTLPPARRPSWDDLAAFMAVVVHGSMNRAAAMLGESQPTVGRRLKRLEAVLGLALLRREPNRVAPTEAGRAIAEALAPLADVGDSVTAALAAHTRPAGAPLRLTCTTSVALFLTGRLAHLRAAIAPADVVLLPSRRTLDIARGEADIALRMRGPGTQDGLVARKLGVVSFTMYATSRDPRLPVILPSDRNDMSRQLALACRFLATRPAGPIVDEMHLRIEAVLAGVGIGSLPCWFGDATPGLVRVSDDPADVLREDILMVRALDERRDVPRERLARALVALFKLERARLAGDRA